MFGTDVSLHNTNKFCLEVTYESATYSTSIGKTLNAQVIYGPWSLRSP